MGLIVMEFGKINITDIKPADYNPRKISNEEYERLINSVKTFGLVDPIIINLNDNTIIGGHQRYDVLMDMYINDEIAKELPVMELGDIGWVFLDEHLIVGDELSEMGLNLALNKISGEWDEDKLSIILKDLEVDGFDVSLTGFNVEEVKNMTFVEEDVFDELKGFKDFEDDDEDETGSAEKVYFKLVLMLSSEKEQEELYLQLQEEGYDCQILTY